MRVQILKESSGVIDRVGLSTLIPGSVYNLPLHVAEYLISISAAQRAEEPALEVPTSDEESLAERIAEGVHVSQPRAEAADTPPTRRGKRR